MVGPSDWLLGCSFCLKHNPAPPSLPCSLTPLPVQPAPPPSGLAQTAPLWGSRRLETWAATHRSPTLTVPRLCHSDGSHESRVTSPHPHPTPASSSAPGAELRKSGSGLFTV